MMSNANGASAREGSAVQQVRRFVERHHDRTHRFGECADAFLRGAGNDVLLLELAAGLERMSGILNARSYFSSELICW